MGSYKLVSFLPEIINPKQNKHKKNQKVHKYLKTAPTYSILYVAFSIFICFICLPCISGQELASSPVLSKMESWFQVVPGIQIIKNTMQWSRILVLIHTHTRICTFKTEHSIYTHKMFSFLLTIWGCEINRYCEIDLGSVEKANTNLIK